MGIHGKVSRTNLARANEKRDWRIYRDFAHHLIAVARKLYAGDKLSVELNNAVYAFDSTTIDLCLSLFPWARFMDGTGGKRKGAIKLHTLLDLRGNIPSFVHISTGKVSDIAGLDKISIEPSAFYILDRGYLDFSRLHRIQQASAFFVTRSKSNIKFRRLYSRPVDRAQGIIADQTITLFGRFTPSYYPEQLRRIRYRDPSTGMRLVFLTNNFKLPAHTVAELYRMRWQIELFFKWIKQHLRIKQFYGTSDNAVKTQVWIAIATYVLVVVVKKRLALPQSIYTILQILSISLGEKVPISRMFHDAPDTELDVTTDNQLNLFRS